MKDTLAVIIPYYQNDSVLLTKAVASILNQSVPSHVQVLIVIANDSSPSAPELSLKNLKIKSPFEVVIETQANGGAAAARNLGLDLLAKISPRYVAFLDSDDEWLEGHIDEAVKHMDMGADFWFTDTLDNDSSTYFSYQEFMISRHSIGRDETPVVTSMSGSEAFSHMVFDDCLPHTSTVVYNLKKMPALRFSTDLKIAGEDQLFWMSAVSASDQIMYSTSVNGRRGRGVSIYRNNINWNSPNVLTIVTYQALLRQKIAETFSLTSKEKTFNDSKSRHYRDRLVYLSTRNFFKTPKNVVEKLRQANRILPNFWSGMIGGLLRLPKHKASIRKPDKAN